SGDAIILFVKHEGASTTITASDGTSSFTGATILDNVNGDMHTRMLYLLSSSASGSVTYTITFGAARPFKVCAVWEIRAASGVVVFDTEPTGGGSQGNQGSGSHTFTTANFTVSGPNAFVLGGFGNYTGNSLANGKVNSVLSPDQLFMNENC